MLRGGHRTRMQIGAQVHTRRDRSDERGNKEGKGTAVLRELHVGPPSSLSTPGSGSRRVLYPLSWEDATPLGTPYDGCSGVDIELECRLERRYIREEIEVMREEIRKEKEQQYLENFM